MLWRVSNEMDYGYSGGNLSRAITEMLDCVLWGPGAQRPERGPRIPYKNPAITEGDSCIYWLQ